MSEENINEETVIEKNIPVFIETDGHVVQVGLASEVQENGGRAIEKFSAFKKVTLVNPIFGDGEGEISTPDIESHINPEEEGLTGPGNGETTPGFPTEAGVSVNDTQDAPSHNGHPFGSDDHSGNQNDDEEAEFERQLAEEQAQTEAGQNAAPVEADPDGDTAVGKAAPAPLRGDRPDPFTRTN